MTLKVDRIAPNRLRLTRRFAAPPERVWQAHFDPEILPRWLTGPDGWTMTECEVDLRTGGGFRCVWAEDATGEGFHITGTYDVLDPPRRSVHREVMHLPDPTPENLIETLFEPDGSGTLMIQTMTLPDADSVETMLATGMTEGMELSYARFETLEAAA